MPTSSYFFKEEKKKPLGKRVNKKIVDLKNQIIQLKNISPTISDKITFVLIIWTLILFVVTTSTRIEIYYVLIFLSLIATKELSIPFATDHLKKRINLFIIVFLGAYLFIFVQRLSEIM